VGCDQDGDIFDMVLIAIDHDPLTKKLGLERVSVHVYPTTTKILVDAAEQTNILNIYAISDMTFDRPELALVATQVGKLLARQLFGSSYELVCYYRISTTIFTSLEYGCCGMPEEEVMASYRKSDIEVFYAHFKLLEWILLHREKNTCFVKLVCLKSENYHVNRLYILALNADEITQGYVVAFRMNVTKHDIEATIGIHLTVAEEVLRLRIIRASGEVATVTDF
jgi:pyruvate/2-oxoglutarate dehydrogenase complex dihydrolipoamide dehydrogenase (E3) component